MSPITLHFASGNTFFFGVIIFIAVALLSIPVKKKRWYIVFRIIVILGILGILFSSTPLPVWFYVLWAIPVFWLLGYLYAEKKMKTGALHLIRLAVILFSLIAVGIEIPYHTKPAIEFDPGRPLIIIGDSLSAGVENDNVTATWPTIFKEQFHLNVVDLSGPGFTLQPVIKLVKELDWQQFENPVFLLEIGGNDMLGGTGNIHQFEEDLNELLHLVSQVSDTVIMLELPLPPFHNYYGKAQRKLAEKYRAVLVPKRCFANVLGRRNATFDSLHLSQSGHQDMADMLWNLMK